MEAKFDSVRRSVRRQCTTNRLAFLLLLAPAIHFYFSFCSSTPLYDFWLWLGFLYFFSSYTGFNQKLWIFFYIHTIFSYQNPLFLSFACFLSFLSLSLSHYLPLYLTIPPLFSLLPLFSLFFFHSFNCLYSTLCIFLQLPHDNFNLSKYARELFFSFSFFLFLFFFLSSCLLS